MTRNTAQTSAPASQSATQPATRPVGVTGIRVRSRVQAGVCASLNIMCCPAA